MLAQPVGMMQAADGRDHSAMLGQRFQRLRQLIVAAGGRHLKFVRVHAVRQIDEHAALRTLGRLRRKQRTHAIQQRQRKRHAQAAQHMPAIEQPILAKELSHAENSPKSGRTLLG